MTPLLFFSIEGDPVPWAAHQGYGRRSFNPRWREREYVEAKIKQQYTGSILLDSPIRVDFSFYVRIPSSFSKKKRELSLEGKIHPVARPDRSNYLKFYEDCLIGTVIKDDSIIIHGFAGKHYALEPHVTISISQIQ